MSPILLRRHWRWGLPPVIRRRIQQLKRMLCHCIKLHRPRARSRAKARKTTLLLPLERPFRTGRIKLLLPGGNQTDRQPFRWERHRLRPHARRRMRSQHRHPIRMRVTICHRCRTTTWTGCERAWSRFRANRPSQGSRHAHCRPRFSHRSPRQAFAPSMSRCSRVMKPQAKGTTEPVPCTIVSLTNRIAAPSPPEPCGSQVSRGRSGTPRLTQPWARGSVILVQWLSCAIFSGVLVKGLRF